MGAPKRIGRSETPEAAGPLVPGVRPASALLTLAACALALVIAPSAQALCAGGACVIDEAQRDGSRGCDGTVWMTGVWASSSLLAVYAIGERRECTNGWSGMGGDGVRVGLIVPNVDSEVRWYNAAAGGCSTSVHVMDFDAGADCLLPAPRLPWGNVLP